MINDREKPQKNKYGCAILFFFILGVGLIFLSLADMVNAYASSKWPTVTGSVVQSSIHIGKDKGTYYCPDISWTYRVAGVTYAGSNEPFCDTRVKAQATIAKYPVGASVAISYSPQDPGESTIEPGKLKFPIVFLLLGLAAIIVAYYLI